MKFSALLSSVNSLPALAKLDPAASARNPKTIRRNRRALKIRKGQIVADEMKKAEIAAKRAAGRKRNAAVLAKHKRTVNGLE